MAFIEFKPSGKRFRWLVKNQDGVELVLSAGRRTIVITYDPDKVDIDMTPDDGYRFFAKAERAQEES